MPNLPRSSSLFSALTFEVRTSLSPAIRGARRRVRTYHVSVAGSTIGGWSQASSDAAIADWKKQAIARLKGNRPMFDLPALRAPAEVAAAALDVATRSARARGLIA